MTDADDAPVQSAPDPVNAEEPAPDSAPDPFCGAPDPFGEDHCTLVPGHMSSQAHDNSKWPNRKPR